MKFSTILRRNEDRLDPKNVLDTFCENFGECELFDICYSGYEFEWKNWSEDGEIIEERLDQFSKIIHLTENTSNHLTLLFKLHEFKNSRENKRFMFENMWVQEEIELQTGGEGTMGNRAVGQPMEQFNLQDGNIFEGIVKWKLDIFGERIKELARQFGGEKDIHKRHILLRKISKRKRGSLVGPIGEDGSVLEPKCVKQQILLLTWNMRMERGLKVRMS
ncbi:LOW QUALITY PROTEIN: hypothetical protein Cgig2_005226 [Carnegiea gigantea]|uniref:Uncharacterized protein n=1 Tax=Carnegiea gigantea TaxID=171969 RepID=A0A9Q1QBS1_9CARY|nr:LOW QUALITY PROTEIN: hypothetical protein Cgig2_005226 [Carnegiea gigantea]